MKTPGLQPSIEERMAAATVRHQHRHYKTLIVLVLAMTGGTFLLFWVGKLAPVIPLRGNTQVAPSWDRILVRAEPADAVTASGFYHLRIDGCGWLYQSSAWNAGRQDRNAPGTIQLVLTSDQPGGKITPAQSQALSHVIADLCKQYRIRPERIAVTQSPGPPRLAGMAENSDY